MSAPALRSTRSQRGVSLLEVLVALVVMSIGLIGIAGLQSTALKMNNSAYMRSQATVLAYDMADRVRANADAGTAYNQPNPTFNANCENNTGCSPQAMAGNDMFRWRAQIGDAMLPLGSGTICLDATPATIACDGAGDTYVIRVTWDEDRNGTADPNDPNENIVLSFSR